MKVTEQIRSVLRDKKDESIAIRIFSDGSGFVEHCTIYSSTPITRVGFIAQLPAHQSEKILTALDELYATLSNSTTSKDVIF